MSREDKLERAQRERALYVEHLKSCQLCTVAALGDPKEAQSRK